MRRAKLGGSSILYGANEGHLIVLIWWIVWSGIFKMASLAYMPVDLACIKGRIHSAEVVSWRV